MKKTLVEKDSPIFKISTNDIRDEFGTESRSVLNKAMDFFGLTYRDSEHVNFYIDQYRNNAFEVFMTKNECLAFAELYGHERRRIIKTLVSKLEIKYKESNNCQIDIEEGRKEVLKSIKIIQKRIDELTSSIQLANDELKKQLEILTQWT